MSRISILTVDDEKQIRKLLEITLQLNDYLVTEAATAREALSIARLHPPDLVLLDLGLPDRSGQEVLVELREWYIHPIIILSVQSDEQNIIKALDNGANDFLVKPFRTGELLARIRSALRTSVHDEARSKVQFGDVQIDLGLRTVHKAGCELKLTGTEYALLSLLARHEGALLTHSYLLREIWGPGYISQSQYLRVFIAQLRKKIEDDPNRPVYLTTEAGIGYRLRTGNVNDQ